MNSYGVRLHMKGCLLEPVGIGALIHLRELRVSGNKLSSLSAEVGSLRKLHRLIADNNLLTSIPGTSPPQCILQLVTILSVAAWRKASYLGCLPRV